MTKRICVVCRHNADWDGQWFSCRECLDVVCFDCEPPFWSGCCPTCAEKLRDDDEEGES